MLLFFISLDMVFVMQFVHSTLPGAPIKNPGVTKETGV